MKNFFKLFGIIALTAVIVFGFVACSNGSTDKNDEPKAFDWKMANISYTPDSNTAITGIAWGGGKYIAVTRGSTSSAILPKIMQSADGINWTEVTPNPFTAERIQNIAWSGTTFIAVGRNGEIAFSPDGQIWTLSSNSTTVFGATNSDTVQCITWGGSPGKFLAGGSKARMVESTDGDTWTLINDISTTANSDYINAIVWGGPSGNQKFIAGTVTGGDGRLFKSSDGTNSSWSEITPLPTLGSSYRGFDTVIWGGPSGQEKFIAGSEGTGGTGESIMLYSTDGESWEAATHPFGSNRIRGIAFGGGRFVAVGHGGIMAESSDGISWTELVNPLDGIIYAITYANGKFVAVGDSGIAYTDY